jgi:hypothetical protein
MKQLQILVYKIIILFFFIILFAVLYKKKFDILDKDITDVQRWKNAFYISTLTQTLSGPPELHENVRVLVIIQNLIGYILLIGAFIIIIHSYK